MTRWFKSVYLLFVLSSLVQWYRHFLFHVDWKNKNPRPNQLLSMTSKNAKFWKTTILTTLWAFDFNTLFRYIQYNFFFSKIIFFVTFDIFFFKKFNSSAIWCNAIKKLSSIDIFQIINCICFQQRKIFAWVYFESLQNVFRVFDDLLIVLEQWF